MREAAIGAIGAFASRAGSLAPFSKHLGSLDDAKRRLLEERIGASPQEAEAGAMQATVQAPAKPSGVTMRLGTRSQPAAVPQRRAAPANVAAKVATRSGARGVGEGRTNKAAGPPGTAAPQVWSSPAGGPAMSEEEAVAALGNSGCAPGALAGLKSASWRDRMEAAEALRDALSSGAVPGAAAAVALSGVLSREKNAQAGAAIIEAIGAAAGNPDGGVGAAEARAAAGAVAEKIGEAKCARAAGEALSSLCEAAGTAVVSAAVRKCCEGAKSPKTRAEGLAWAGKALREFGAAQMDVAAVVGWAMAELEAANAQVRSSAVALLGEAHRVVGGRVRAMVRDRRPFLTL